MIQLPNQKVLLFNYFLLQCTYVSVPKAYGCHSGKSLLVACIVTPDQPVSRSEYCQTYSNSATSLKVHRRGKNSRLYGECRIKFHFTFWVVAMVWEAMWKAITIYLKSIQLVWKAITGIIQDWHLHLFLLFLVADFTDFQGASCNIQHWLCDVLWGNLYTVLLQSSRRKWPSP